jgi:hypothetical protein
MSLPDDYADLCERLVLAINKQPDSDDKIKLMRSVIEAMEMLIRHEQAHKLARRSMGL